MSMPTTRFSTTSEMDRYDKIVRDLTCSLRVRAILWICFEVPYVIVAMVLWSHFMSTVDGAMQKVKMTEAEPHSFLNTSLNPSVGSHVSYHVSPKYCHQDPKKIKGHSVVGGGFLEDSFPDEGSAKSVTEKRAGETVLNTKNNTDTTDGKFNGKTRDKKSGKTDKTVGKTDKTDGSKDNDGSAKNQFTGEKRAAGETDTKNTDTGTTDEKFDGKTQGKTNGKTDEDTTGDATGDGHVLATTPEAEDTTTAKADDTTTGPVTGTGDSPGAAVGTGAGVTAIAGATTGEESFRDSKNVLRLLVRRYRAVSIILKVLIWVGVAKGISMFLSTMFLSNHQNRQKVYDDTGIVSRNCCTAGCDPEGCVMNNPCWCSSSQCILMWSHLYTLFGAFSIVKDILLAFLGSFYVEDYVRLRKRGSSVSSGTRGNLEGDLVAKEDTPDGGVDANQIHDRELIKIEQEAIIKGELIFYASLVMIMLTVVSLVYTTKDMINLARYVEKRMVASKMIHEHNQRKSPLHDSDDRKDMGQQSTKNDSPPQIPAVIRVEETTTPSNKNSTPVKSSKKNLSTFLGGGIFNRPLGGANLGMSEGQRIVPRGIGDERLEAGKRPTEKRNVESDVGIEVQPSGLFTVVAMAAANSNLERANKRADESSNRNTNKNINKSNSGLDIGSIAVGSTALRIASLKESKTRRTETSIGRITVQENMLNHNSNRNSISVAGTGSNTRSLGGTGNDSMSVGGTGNGSKGIVVGPNIISTSNAAKMPTIPALDSDIVEVSD